MLRASYFAGCTFTKSYVPDTFTVPIPSAENITCLTDLQCRDPAYGAGSLWGQHYLKLRNLAVAAGLCDKNGSNETASRMFIDAVKDVKKRFGIGDAIFGNPETDIPELAHYVAKKPILCIGSCADGCQQTETLYYRLMPPAGCWVFSSAIRRLYHSAYLLMPYFIFRDISFSDNFLIFGKSRIFPERTINSMEKEQITKTGKETAPVFSRRSFKSRFPYQRHKRLRASIRLTNHRSMLLSEKTWEKQFPESYMYETGLVLSGKSHIC